MPWESSISLIPRQVLFGNPDKAQPRLSPDGAHLSYLAAVNGVLNGWVAPVDHLAEARSITADTGRGIRLYDWAFTNHHILYIQDKGGDENWRIYSVELNTGKTVDLTPLEGVQARFEQISPDRPEEILISINERNPQLHDLYVVDLRTAPAPMGHPPPRRLVLENDGFLGFVTDQQYHVHLAQRMNKTLAR
jgi:hypothetical protein